MRHVQSGNGRHAAGPRPSETAQRRLAAAIDREVGDLRVRVHEGLLRSEILLEMGRPDEAAEALDESRMLVDQIHERLSSAVAAAAVEREAEAILAAVDAPAADARLEPPDAVTPRTRTTGVLAALASAAAGLIFLATPSTPQDTPALSVEDRTPPAVTSDAEAAEAEAPDADVDGRAGDRDASLAAAALAAIEQHTSTEPDRDPVAAPAPPTDPAEPPDTDGDWLQQLLNVRFGDGPTVLDVLDPVLDALPEGGPPLSETIEETQPPVDDEADTPAVPDVP